MSTMTALAEPASAGRLLVIDDDRTQRLLIGEIGRRAGFFVDTVGTLEDAFIALRDTSYATVAIDLSLGDKDGVEIIGHIAETGQRPAIIVISGFDARIRDAAMRFGHSLGLNMVGELRKPIDIAQLRGLLSQKGHDEGPHAKAAQALREIGPEHVGEALSRGEIVPVFQPKVLLETGRIIAVEALARWTSREFGSVPPSVFVPIAEQNGLADELTRSILRQSLAAAAQWNHRWGEFGVAVNVPPSSLVAADFTEMVDHELGVAGCAAGTLTLEVTESTAMADVATTSGVLTRLRIKGIQISLDDFGTGYSSLTSLLRMPFGELKIDRSFIQSCDSDNYAWKIARATLSLAREFGMKTVAEGIETSTVASMLRLAQCDIGQGYHFARPLSRELLEQRLASQE